MFTKSHTHEMYGTLRKMSNCTKGHAEIHIQWPFFDSEKGIWKILVMKIQTVSTCFGAPSTLREIVVLKNTKILSFGCISKFLGLINVIRYVLPTLVSTFVPS
jgi:hypothetical protein